MNKTELVNEIADKLGPGTSPKEVIEFLDTTVDTIVRAVNRGESVTVTGFGVFEKRRRAPRVARNPRTGESVKVRATSVPAFRPSAQFKDILARKQKLPKVGPAVGRGAPARAAVKKAAPTKAAPTKAAPTKAAAKKAAPTKAATRKR